MRSPLETRVTQLVYLPLTGLFNVYIPSVDLEGADRTLTTLFFREGDLAQV